MVLTLIYLSLLSAQPETEKPCDGRFEVTQQAYRFADLPQESMMICTSTQKGS